MEENTQAVNDATQEANGLPETKPSKDVVAYTTYSKVLGTLKKREGELDEIKSRLEAMELEKKQAEGNKDEVITTLRDQLSSFKENETKLKHQYAWSVLEGQIKTKAIKEGCVNPDKLIKLLGDDDLKGVEVDDRFQVNNEDLSRLLEKAKKDHSDIGLFKAKSVNVNDLSPQQVQVKGKKVEDMTAAELKKHILSMKE